MRKEIGIGVSAVALASLLLTTAGRNAVAADVESARRAFLEAAPVFLHPRCLNCHPRDDRPLQGDESRPHAQLVKRGPDGHGRFAMKCQACHQTRNLKGAHLPPGAPNWHLPPPTMRMVFEGRTPGELCRQLKDRGQNGGKSVAEIVRHASEDPLVGWGWDPGAGRTPAPGRWAEFGALMKTWADNGAECPK